MENIRTMRYEIIKPINEEWSVLGEILRELQYNSWLLANRTIQMLWDFQNLSFSYKERFGDYLNMKKIPNKYTSIKGDIRNQLKPHFYKLSSDSLDSTIQKAYKRWDGNKSKILKGEQSVINYKRNFPIQVTNKQITLIKENNNYYIQLGLISIEYAKELGRKTPKTKFKLLIKAEDKSQKEILERLISSQYQLGSSELLHIKKGKTKWFINLAYKFEKEKTKLDKNKIMGIDLGIVNAATMAFNFSPGRKIIEGGEIKKFRDSIEARRLSLLKQGKYCGDGRRGHGRKTRIKPIEKLTDKVENFRKTTNHKYSRYIVDMALKHECGVIQMEDLSNIARGDRKNTILGSWSYYDLQQKVKYKAEEVGIEVRFIKPSFTSQRCSKCGHIEKKNRESQSIFRCKNCNFSTNADFNAAKNISTENIEDIIKAELYKNNELEEAFNVDLVPF